MSRSYKKFPTCKDVKSGKTGKKLANRKVRNWLKRGIEIANGSAYQKVYNSWDIYDYRFHTTEREVYERWKREEAYITNGIFPWTIRYHKTLKEEMHYWYKHYKMK